MTEEGSPVKLKSSIMAIPRGAWLDVREGVEDVDVDVEESSEDEVVEDESGG